MLRNLTFTAQLICLSFGLLFLHAAGARTVTVNPPSSDHHRYCFGLLKLALAYHGSKYTLVTRNEDSGNQAREVQDLNDGKVSVIWIATSTEFEEQLQPVRVPLYKGLLGHRIFIIHRGQQARFDQVRTLDDLRQVALGQGLGWTDTEILEANSMKVVKAAKFDSLFHMLDGGRFAAFPRGVHEPWSEVTGRPDLELAIEDKLMLVYKMPMYFFVAQSDQELAADIESALLTAIDDGSFDRYFLGTPMIRDVLEKANMGERKAFELHNPLLPPKTPLDNAKLWFNPDLL